MLTPVKDIPNIATINFFIDEETGSGILETVNAFFDPDTAEQILSIYISRHGEDFVCWPNSKHGLYIVLHIIWQG
jgi:hypothetical protein